MDAVILSKMQRYCSYQERTETEVRQKLASFRLTREDEKAILEQLIAECYFDNERFTEIYVKSKSAKAWGKNKIKVALLQKKIPETLIRKYLASINLEQDRKNIVKLIDKWLKVNKKQDNVLVKLYRYLYGKGYDVELISETLKSYEL
ncbi:MAG: RecX family transcriptional regulator [Bacteroidales bacterium]|jgi:regulatory protein|nr:RecX family transcriptional regulator [Bacteroidales bacterium]